MIGGQIMKLLMEQKIICWLMYKRQSKIERDWIEVEVHSQLPMVANGK